MYGVSTRNAFDESLRLSPGPLVLTPGWQSQGLNLCTDAGVPRDPTVHVQVDNVLFWLSRAFRGVELVGVLIRTVFEDKCLFILFDSEQTFASTNTLK